MALLIDTHYTLSGMHLFDSCHVVSSFDHNCFTTCVAVLPERLHDVKMKHLHHDRRLMT